MRRVLSILIALPLALSAACGDHAKQTPADAGVNDAPTGMDASCFDITNKPNPTYNEIINACTTSQKIYKDSHPPHALPDGGLPPVP